jgi:transcriptional regulator
MFIPQKFEVTDKEEILSFIKANAFGQLISTVKGRYFSTHIPFLLSGDEHSIICHIAKSNPQWEGIEDQEILVTFQGPHDYVSPSWYKSPGVPTWNYQAAHIYGKPALITQANELEKIVTQLAGIYEAALEPPWKPEYKGSMLKAIVGIKIVISEIQCKYKLSQNRSEVDQNQVIAQLENRGSTQLSQAMKNGL